MPEAPHIFKNTRARFEALPQTYHDTRAVGNRRDAPLRAVCALRAPQIPQGCACSLSPEEIRQWREKRDRQGARAKPGMERFRGSATGRLGGKPRAVRHRPRRSEEAARPEFSEAGWRIRKTRCLPILNSSIWHEPGQTHANAETMLLVAGNRRTLRGVRADARNMPRLAEPDSPQAIPPNSHESRRTAQEFQLRGRATPVPSTVAQAPRYRRERRHSGRRARQGRSHGRAR